MSTCCASATTMATEASTTSDVPAQPPQLPGRARHRSVEGYFVASFQRTGDQNLPIGTPPDLADHASRNLNQVAILERVLEHRQDFSVTPVDRDKRSRVKDERRHRR